MGSYQLLKALANCYLLPSCTGGTFTISCSDLGWTTLHFVQHSLTVSIALRYLIRPDTSSAAHNSRLGDLSTHSTPSKPLQIVSKLRTGSLDRQQTQQRRLTYTRTSPFQKSTLGPQLPTQNTQVLVLGLQFSPTKDSLRKDTQSVCKTTQYSSVFIPNKKFSATDESETENPMGARTKERKQF